jgi:hypothetical protein
MTYVVLAKQYNCQMWYRATWYHAMRYACYHTVCNTYDVHAVTVHVHVRYTIPPFETECKKCNKHEDGKTKCNTKVQ